MPEEQKFKSVSLFSVKPGEPLPFSLAIYYLGRFIIYRAKGQVFEVSKYNRFIYKKISKIYIPEEDVHTYNQYIIEKQSELDERLYGEHLTTEQKTTNQTVHSVESVIQDLFSSATDYELAAGTHQVLHVARSTVERVCTKSYLRIFESIPEANNTVVTHSIRVSLMATFLAYQLGFVNALALEHIAAAGMLHDIGKTALPLSDDLELNENQEPDIMKQHPEKSVEMLKTMENVPDEVLRIILEHHECRDGSGYPHGVRGRKMLGLSKVFQIANTFDNLVCDTAGTREQRYLLAVETMQTSLRARFEPTLLPKALRVLLGQADGKA